MSELRSVAGGVDHEAAAAGLKISRGRHCGSANVTKRCPQDVEDAGEISLGQFRQQAVDLLRVYINRYIYTYTQYIHIYHICINICKLSHRLESQEQRRLAPNMAAGSKDFKGTEAAST